MAYRNGTYIAFHAEGTSDPTESDMKYYRLLQAWNEHKKIEFEFVNSHDKTAAVRDSSSRETLKARLRERLGNSKNLLLIVGSTTRLDRDWIPFEIAYAVDNCEIPIIAAYTGYESIMAPAELSPLWPAALQARITNKSARVLHIPFKKDPILAGINQFNLSNLPSGSLSYYSREAHQQWGLVQ